MPPANPSAALRDKNPATICQSVKDLIEKFRVAMPRAWQIVAEKRATFAAIPSQESLRPATRTRWPNLMLAGDWTATGLPATIEGAIRSGQKAADLLMNPSTEQ